jgi:ferrous iron transport protein A
MHATRVETIEHVPIGARRVITRVVAPGNAPEWAQRLEEIGFIPGERIVVMARGSPGGDPMVVRVGLSTFALRRAEAACVHLAPADAPAD